MEQTISKNWILAGLGVLVIFGLKWINNHWIHRADRFQDVEYSYEMSRAQESSSNFDLSGRDIDRQVLTDEEKLALEAKKSEVTKAKADQKISAAGTKKSADKNKKFQVNTVNTAREMSLTEANGTENTKQLVQAQEFFAPEALPPASTQNKNTKSNSKSHTVAEWRALLASHATGQIISEFIAAHQAKEIADAEFYSIALDLFNNQNSQQHQTGMDILSMDTSPNGFVFIATEYIKQTVGSSNQGGTSSQQQTNTQQTGGQSSTSQNGQGNISGLWTILQSYAQPAKFAALNSGLNSTDTKIVAIALQILSLAVQDAQQQQQVNIAGGTSGSNVGGTQPQRTLAGTSPQSLGVFIATLTSLSQNGSSNSSAAQTLLPQVKALANG